MSDFEPQQSGISRRTVTKAMAWAVPAIAVAAPIPAFAGASQGTIEFSGTNCKLPGSSSPFTNGAVYFMTVTNTTAVASTINILSVARTGQSFTSSDVMVVRLSGTGLKCESLGSSFTANANSSDTFALITKEWSNSASGDLSVTYQIDGATQPPAGSASGSLSPITSNPNCGIGGSCSADESWLQCIMHAIGQANCPVIP